MSLKTREGLTTPLPTAPGHRTQDTAVGGRPQPQFRKGWGRPSRHLCRLNLHHFVCVWGAHQVSPYLQVETMQIFHICSNFCPHNFSACEWVLPATMISVLFSHDLHLPSFLLRLEELGFFCKEEMHLLSPLACLLTYTNTELRRASRRVRARCCHVAHTAPAPDPGNLPGWP